MTRRLISVEVSPHSLPLAFPPPTPVGSAPAVSTLNTTPTPGMVTVSWTPRCVSPPHRCCSKGSWLVWPAVWGSGFGAEVVGASGRQPGPLGGGTSVRGELAAPASPPLRPALGRVLPELLPAVGGQIQESVRRCHHFIAAPGGPVGLEDLVTVSEIAGQDAEMPVCGQLVHGVLRHRVPRNIPTHEVTVTDALLVRTFAERGVGNVAGMQVGQLANLAVGEGAALALGAGGLTSMPHVIVDDQLSPALEDREQRDRSMRAKKLDGGVYLHHRQPSASCRDRIPFAGVRLFPYPQSVQFCLPGGPVDHRRQRRGVEAFGEMVLITCVHRWFLSFL